LLTRVARWVWNRRGTWATRRKRRGGTRVDQAAKLIEKSPGISASEVAKMMKIKPNYLYRVLGDLEKEGSGQKAGASVLPQRLSFARSTLMAWP